MLAALLAFLGPWGAILGVVGVLATSASTGAYMMHKWDNASYYKAEAEASAKKLHTIQLAQQVDAKAALAASARADALQKKIDNVKIANPSSKCFTRSESDSLRALWR